MATLRNYTYSAAAGGIIYAGRNALPSWLASRAINEWVAVPNSTLIGSGAEASVLGAYGRGSAKIINSENSCGYDTVKDEVWIGAAGGHLDWLGNSTHSIAVNSETPGLILRRDTSVLADIPPSSRPSPDLAFYYDGKPASRHTYSGIFFSEVLKKLIMIGGLPWPNANGDLSEPITFDPAASDWEPQGTWNNSLSPAPAIPGLGLYAKHPVSGDIYFAEGGAGKFYKLDIRTKVWTCLNTNVGGYFSNYEIPAIDPSRGFFVITTNSGSGTYAALISLTTGVKTLITINSSAAWTAFQALSTNHAGVFYNPDQDVYYYYFGGNQGGSNGGRIFKITPNGTTTWDMVEMTMTGATVPVGDGTVAFGNTLARAFYSPRMKAFGVWPTASTPLYMARVA